LAFAPKKILVLADLSPVTGDVLAWAGLFARKFGAEVEVLHVMWSPAPRDVTADEGEFLLAEFEERRTELRRGISATVEKALGADIPCRIAVGVGHPVKVVLDHIREARPDLIVLGAHGHDGMARSLMGSVAENVARESAFPSLVVKGGIPAESQRPFRRLLCPVDLTKFGVQCVDVSASLAAEFEAALDVLRVAPAGVDEGTALEELRAWVPDVVRQRCAVSEVVRNGDAGEQIIVFARQHDVEVIVVGAEHRRFLEFTTVGRTTERVVRHASCSVLLLCLEAESN
jgi:nucleotide-binding universal stress UspA family protein